MDRTERLASPAATADPDDAKGYYPNPDDEADTRYFDWSLDNGGDGIRFEVGNEDQDALTVNLTRAEVVELHRRLTLWLLTN